MASSVPLLTSFLRQRLAVAFAALSGLSRPGFVDLVYAVSHQSSVTSFVHSVDRSICCGLLRILLLLSPARDTTPLLFVSHAQRLNHRSTHLHLRAPRGSHHHNPHNLRTPVRPAILVTASAVVYLQWLSKYIHCRSPKTRQGRAGQG